MAIAKADESVLNDEEIAKLSEGIPDWIVLEEDRVKKLKRAFDFENFVQALAFTNRVGEISEQEDHHPVIVTEWGKVTVTWWSHEINGLQRNDFVMAAKTDRQLRGRS